MGVVNFCWLPKVFKYTTYSVINLLMILFLKCHQKFYTIDFLLCDFPKIKFVLHNEEMHMSVAAFSKISLFYLVSIVVHYAS